MFENLTILDASTVLAGPSVGTFFAELGARVIKIENPRVPDVTRSWKLSVEDPNSPISAYFSSVNYKKEYISLDLSSSDGQQEFLKLIQTTDILISNFKFGDEEKFVLAPAGGVDLDLGRQVRSGIALLPHAEGRHLGVAQVEALVGVVDAA